MSNASSAAFIARNRSAVLIVPMASTRLVPSSTIARPRATASALVASTAASPSAAADQVSMSCRSAVRRRSIGRAYGQEVGDLHGDLQVRPSPRPGSATCSQATTVSTFFSSTWTTRGRWPASSSSSKSA